MATHSADSFAGVLRRIGRSLARLEREQVCCGDITLQQFETLRLLRDRARTTSELADALGIDISTASRNLAVLERQGYLARARGKDDARQITNGLTRKGTRCVASLCCDEQSVFGALLERIPRDRRSAVVTAIHTLADALEADDSCGARDCCPAPTNPLVKETTP